MFFHCFAQNLKTKGFVCKPHKEFIEEEPAMMFGTMIRWIPNLIIKVIFGQSDLQYWVR